MASDPAHADGSMETRVKALEDAVQSLERRVASLENQLHERAAPASPVSPDKVAWRKLRQGMPARDVESLLGSPTKVDMFGSFAVWHYGGHGGGQVELDTKSQTITGWHEPD
jgi:hypothetical protein